MFVFDRSAAAVLLPLALLVAVVLWSNRSAVPKVDSARTVPAAEASTVANVEQPRQNSGG
jgi:hypothetical protein